MFSGALVTQVDLNIRMSLGRAAKEGTPKGAIRGFSKG
jgi:hypothetical protein